MKALHRPDLFGWSRFDEARNLDFNGTAWIRSGGNVVIDPVEASEHDLNHLAQLGGVAWIVITNSEHVRASAQLAARFGAQVAGPLAEHGKLSVRCERWLAEGEELVPGLRALELHGSKTPGELALLLDQTTLITGDLIRGQRGGALNLLPDAKLSDKAAALASVRRLLGFERIDAVIVGDGWPVFRDGRARLRELEAAAAKS